MNIAPITTIHAHTQHVYHKTPLNKLSNLNN